jgi:hypothetical protein
MNSAWLLELHSNNMRCEVSKWRTVAEDISVETDNKKLCKRIDELFAALDETSKRSH